MKPNLKSVLSLLLFYIAFMSTPKLLKALNTWIQTSSMTIALANHYSAAVNGRIYTIGGSSTIVPQVSLYTNIHPDGTIDSWQNISAVHPGRYWLAGASNSNFIYTLGGSDTTWNSTNLVLLGKIESDGNILRWQNLTSLPKNLANGSAAIVDNRIYYAGGNTDAKNNFWGSMVSDIYMAEINSGDGTIGTWSLVGNLPHSMISFQMTEINGYLYVFGGRDSIQAYSDVWRIRVDPMSGNLGAWETLVSLPKPLWIFGFTRVGDVIVTAGGHDGSNFLSDIFYSNINHDGTLTNWIKSSNSLLRNNVGSPLVAWNNKLYSIGGHDGMTYFNDVYFTDLFDIVGVPNPTPSPTPHPTPTSPPSSKIYVVPGMGASWNTEAFINCTLDDNPSNWSLAPYAEDVYNPIFSALSLSGWDVKQFYYDWRQYISNNAHILDSIIELQSNENEKVNIVGHSMGGLVGKEYFRQMEGEHLESLLTVGSPHKGTAFAYPAWAGGDIWNDNFIAKIAITLYKKHCGGIFYNDREVIQNQIPSLQNLLPTVPYLNKIRELNPYLPSHEINQNNLANDFSNPRGIKVGTIAGSGFETLATIQTKEPTKRDLEKGNWIDGKPAGKIYSTEGDGTVLTSSALLAEASYSATLIQTHSGLMASPEGIAEILNFFNLPSISSPMITNIEPSSAIVIIAYPANLIAINQEGEYKHDKNGIVGFIDPQPGSYKINIYPKSGSVLLIVAQFLPNGKTLYKEYKLEGFGPKFKNLQFNLSEPAADILE